MHPFTPLRVGSIELPNRLIMAPVKTGYGTHTGEVTYRHEAYYRRRAQGGVGTIIVEPLFIDSVGKEHPKQLGISAYEHIKGLRRLVSGLHEDGVLAIAHVNHAGRAANPKASGMQSEAPSEVTCPASGVTPVAMSEERIRTVVREFGGAVRRAREAGFDAVEIQVGHGYLISQFLSSRTNLRSDRYGGSRENRYRFVVEILAAVHKETPEGYPIIARMSATEQVDGGLDLQDATRLAGFLEERGVAALHVASGSACDSPPWYYQHMRLPSGKNLEWATLIKKNVNIPVIAVGRLGDPTEIRSVLGDNVVDAIALGRPLVADPDLPRKMMADHDEDIIQCGACLQGCLMKVKSGEGLACIVNPEVGRESDRYEEAEKPKRVVIIGGGPAGMQAALTASQRGHDVVLFDREGLGGQSSLSSLPPGKAMMKRPLTSLARIVENSTIDLRLSRETTLEDILAEHPDAVVLATGAAPIIPSIPGLDRVQTGEDILTGSGGIGRRVLIMGGGMVGLECAEFLSQRGHKVTIVELLEDVGRDMEPITKRLTLQALKAGDVKILTETKLSRLTGKEAYAIRDDREVSLGGFDSVVAAVGTRSVDDLGPPLAERGIHVKVIGDARTPGGILDAVRDGFNAAVEI